MSQVKTVGVVGGGPAGMMASIYASYYGAQVTLFEKNNRLGRKLAITGKGRCNVTNDCETAEFLKNVISNPKFLYASLSNFDPQDCKRFFENLGVALKTERGRRVFPQSDKAEDIVSALATHLQTCGVNVVFSKVLSIVTKNGKAVGLKTQDGTFSFDSVICATGGASYPLTGSTGDGYEFAKKEQIKVTPLSPSLVPLETVENVSQLMGFAPKNVTLKLVDKETKKVLFEEMGEMLFTHFGVSGPLVLSASSQIRQMQKNRYELRVDFKPALDSKTLDKRILSDFEEAKNKDLENALVHLLPSKMIPFWIEKTGISPTKKVNEITKEERKILCDTLKEFTLTVKGFRPLAEAIITQGGIDICEVSPSTMEAKKVKDLYFCGEVLDVDAVTGGYNLQIAFSTGALAGMNSATEKE